MEPEGNVPKQPQLSLEGWIDESFQKLQEQQKRTLWEVTLQADPAI